MSQNFVLPAYGDRTAPTFDPARPRELIRFFENYEDLWDRTGQTDHQLKKRRAARYATPDVAEEWEALGIWSTGTYNKWKSEVLALYPSASADKRFARNDL